MDASGHWCSELELRAELCGRTQRQKMAPGRDGGSGTEADAKSKASIRRSGQRADLINDSLVV